MKYTFLLPAYKAEFYESALLSILKQTYKDFKILVSDDCSPGDIKGITEKYNYDHRLSYRRNDYNMGSQSLVSHWNLLLDLCDTEYLIMASDDDIYEPNFLEEIDKLVCRYPEIDLFHSRAQIINENGVVVKKDAIYEEYVDWLEFIEQYNYYNHIECIPNLVFRTDSLKKTGGFVDFPLAWCSDTATSYNLAKNGVANTRMILFNFRMSGINITSIYDRVTSTKKYSALNLFDNYMKEKVFSEFSIHDTLLRKGMCTRIVKSHKNLVFGTSISCLKFMSFHEFVDYIKLYKQKGYIDSNIIVIKLIFKWLFNK